MVYLQRDALEDCCYVSEQESKELRLSCPVGRLLTLSVHTVISYSPASQVKVDVPVHERLDVVILPCVAGTVFLIVEHAKTEEVSV